MSVTAGGAEINLFVLTYGSDWAAHRCLWNLGWRKCDTDSDTDWNPWDSLVSDDWRNENEQEHKQTQIGQTTQSKPAASQNIIAERKQKKKKKTAVKLKMSN